MILKHLTHQDSVISRRLWWPKPFNIPRGPPCVPIGAMTSGIPLEVLDLRLRLRAGQDTRRSRAPPSFRCPWTRCHLGSAIRSAHSTVSNLPHHGSSALQPAAYNPQSALPDPWPRDFSSWSKLLQNPPPRCRPLLARMPQTSRLQSPGHWHNRRLLRCQNSANH